MLHLCRHQTQHTLAYSSNEKMVCFYEYVSVFEHANCLLELRSNTKLEI